MSWYKKAFDGGNKGAAKLIERIYQEGLGLAKDPAEAQKWLQKAQ